MNKKHIITMSAIILSIATLTGCDNEKKERHDACSKAVLDFQQSTIQGDKDIDVKAANDVINKYNCTYKDVTSDEKEARKIYLTKHPIKPTNFNPKDGKDYSNQWTN